MKSKVTQLHSAHPSADRRPTICLIPGGPGLSSATLRSMDLLARSFHLAYVDPPGTGGSPALPNPTFDSVCESIESAICDFDEAILLGHSFGGLYSIEIARRGKVRVSGLITIATPLTEGAYAFAVERYLKLRTPELERAESEWEKTPRKETLQNVFGSYGTLFFSSATALSGSEMVQRDPLSSETFLAVLPVISERPMKRDFLATLSKLSCEKLFIGGEQDLMFMPTILSKDLDSIGASINIISNSGHFVPFDQPEAVARLVEKTFSDGKEE